MDMLKITRKRFASSLIHKIEMYSMEQGSDKVKVDSLRWNRLELCIVSVKDHLMKELDLWGLKL